MTTDTTRSNNELDLDCSSQLSESSQPVPWPETLDEQELSATIVDFKPDVEFIGQCGETDEDNLFNFLDELNANTDAGYVALVSSKAEPERCALWVTADLDVTLATADRSAPTPALSRLDIRGVAFSDNRLGLFERLCSRFTSLADECLHGSEGTGQWFRIDNHAAIRAFFEEFQQPS